MKIRDDDQGDALAPEPGVAEAPMGLVDPIVMARSLARAVFSAARKPTAMLGVGARVGVRSGQAAFAAGGRFIGVMREGPAGPVESDKRFTDRAFQQNPFYYLLAQEYLVLAKALD